MPDVLKTEISTGQTFCASPVKVAGCKSNSGRIRRHQKAAEEWNKKVETKIRTSSRLRDKLDKKRIAEEEAAEAELAAQIAEIEEAKPTPSKNKKRKAKRKRRESREAEAKEQSDEEEILLQPTKKAKSK